MELIAGWMLVEQGFKLAQKQREAMAKGQINKTPETPETPPEIDQIIVIESQTPTPPSQLENKNGE